MEDSEKFIAISNKILSEEDKLVHLEAKKKSAGTLGEEKATLMEVEKQKSYLKGIKDAINMVYEGKF